MIKVKIRPANARSRDTNDGVLRMKDLGIGFVSVRANSERPSVIHCYHGVAISFYPIDVKNMP